MNKPRLTNVNLVQELREKKLTEEKSNLSWFNNLKKICLDIYLEN